MKRRGLGLPVRVALFDWVRVEGIKMNRSSNNRVVVNMMPPDFQNGKYVYKKKVGFVMAPSPFYILTVNHFPIELMTLIYP